MNSVNNSWNNDEEETKLIISSLLTDMIMKVLLMRQQHLKNYIDNFFVDVENERDKKIQYNICVKYQKKRKNR